MQKRVLSSGVRIEYDISRVRGAHQYLVFLHGAGGDLTAWRAERAYFHRHGVPTIAIDLRGHGKSDRPATADAYALAHFAEDVHAVLRKERIRTFVLVGHCFGGMVTIRFHSIYPADAAAYVLIDTTYKAPAPLKGIVARHPFMTHLLNRLLEREDLRKEHFSHVKAFRFKGTKDIDPMRIFSDITHTSFRSWVYTYESIAGFDGIATLKGMRKRVLIIEGEEDSIFDVLKARRIQRLVRHSHLEIVPKANHILVLNNSRAVEEDIYAYLRSIGFLHP